MVFAEDQSSRTGRHASREHCPGIVAMVRAASRECLVPTTGIRPSPCRRRLLPPIASPSFIARDREVGRTIPPDRSERDPEPEYVIGSGLHRFHATPRGGAWKIRRGRNRGRGEV